MEKEEKTVAEPVKALKVMFVPSHWDAESKTKLLPRVIDAIDQRDGKEVGHFSGETLEELRKRHPTAEIGDLAKIAQMREDMQRTDPVPCTKEAFWDALECLPPEGWQHTGSIAESFKMSERTSGRMTAIYARIGESYWSFTDVYSITHQEIIDKVKSVVGKTTTA